jgi:hypothetical protein
VILSIYYIHNRDNNDNKVLVVLFISFSSFFYLFLFSTTNKHKLSYSFWLFLLCTQIIGKIDKEPNEVVTEALHRWTQCMGHHLNKHNFLRRKTFQFHCEKLAQVTVYFGAGDKNQSSRSWEHDSDDHATAREEIYSIYILKTLLHTTNSN